MSGSKNCGPFTQWDTTQQNKRAPTLHNSMNGTGEHYAKWNKPGGEGQIQYDLTFNWNIINKTNKTRLLKQKPSTTGGCNLTNYVKLLSLVIHIGPVFKNYRGAFISNINIHMTVTSWETCKVKLKIHATYVLLGLSQRPYK